MPTTSSNVVIIGAGSIGTALGNVLAENNRAHVVLHSIEMDVIDSINQKNINTKYFPSFRLDSRLSATQSDSILENADVVFLAIPSLSLIDYLEGVRSALNPNAILINLAKGFGRGHSTIVQCLKEDFQNPITTLKGPSFAKEIIHRTPTGFTLGCDDLAAKERIVELFADTSIYLDHSTDLIGVELLSILKNIYAILLGIVDAQYDSANIRFLILTKAFNEMKEILVLHGGSVETLFKYCGTGDFNMTSLNDLSRNRTLGLLIGKGFFTDYISHELVLEGKVATNVFYEEMSKLYNVKRDFPIISELYKVLNGKYDISAFIDRILRF